MMFELMAKKKLLWTQMDKKTYKICLCGQKVYNVGENIVKYMYIKKEKICSLDEVAF